MMNSWIFAITGPNVYRVPVASQAEFVEYESSRLEYLCTMLIDMTHSFYGILKWTVLLWGPWLLRTVKNTGQLRVYFDVVLIGSLIYTLVLCLRGITRVYNPVYMEFTSLYQLAKLRPDEHTLEKLTLYSFSTPWPSLFDVRQLQPTVRSRVHSILPQRSTGAAFLQPFAQLFAQTIGIRMAYPGCTAFLNSITLPARLEARERLYVLHAIKRMGLTTRGGEFVEGFYVDRRTAAGSESSNGNVLIVCCEGNAGYPEIGIPFLPLDLGYSVVAWNHPGFGISTGMPFPAQEHDAMEAVILFAVEHLKFQFSQIYLYGWSIGGYTASWAAMNFPTVGGLILDATFDDLDELARRTVPGCLYPFVLATVKQTLDLNNAAQVLAYNGPVRIIRRGADEVISTSDPPTRASNRANFLLIRLFRHRFPELMTTDNEARLKQYLALCPEEQTTFMEEMNYNPEKHANHVSNYFKNVTERVSGSETVSDIFPSALGRQVNDPVDKFNMLLYLVAQYFNEAPGTHCAPLPASYFQLPWSPLHCSSNTAQ